MKNPPERVVSSWLGMEDYSACGLTLRARRYAPRGAARRTSVELLTLHPALFSHARKNPPERVVSSWLGMEDSNLH